jgi:hypothetical protein
MKHIAILAAIAATTTGLRAAEPAPAEGQAKVQLAILLDTSSSMNGLIDQARTQLWSVVNTFIDAKVGDQVPFVEVALYEYGNDSLPAESNYIRQIQPLTRDLDQISADLFKLTTNGGSEFCGAVIQRATIDLSWDSSPDVYKAIFIAGNEPFTQGPVDPFEAGKAAITKGIIVNTIHCGSEADGISGKWKDGAAIADGRYLTIDQNAVVVQIDAPQDAQIATLNASLNQTYVPIGTVGRQRVEVQATQDKLAAESSAGNDALCNRAAAKSTANYHNAAWDAVDASREKDFDLSKVPDADLPEEYRGKSLEEKTALIDKARQAREKTQADILRLNQEREAFVAAKRAELAEKSGEQTLDQAVIATVREQAATKGYCFDKTVSPKETKSAE